MNALDNLNQHLADLVDAGSVWPCKSDDRWTSDNADDQAAARARCRPCPVYGGCGAAAVELRVTAGTWAGVTYGAGAATEKAS